MSTDKDLRANEAIEEIKKIAKKVKTAILLTHLTEIPISGRPMYTKEVDDEGNIWFLGTNQSEYYEHIQNDARVQLIYSEPDDVRFMSLFGSAKFVNDPAKVEKLWSKMDNAWFEGKDDPHLILVKITPENGHYWDTKSGKLITFLKIASAGLSGNKTESGVQGNIKV